MVGVERIHECFLKDCDLELLKRAYGHAVWKLSCYQRFIQVSLDKDVNFGKFVDLKQALYHTCKLLHN